MRRIFAVLLLALLPVLIALPAHAKTVDRGVLRGPGLSRPIAIKPGTAADDRRLATVRTGTAITNALLDGLPDVFVAKRPRGDLGPRYRLDWHQPGYDDQWVVQYVYPYAKHRPVVYTPKQKGVVHPGWFRAPSYLKRTLTALGLPARKPIAASPALLIDCR